MLHGDCGKQGVHGQLSRAEDTHGKVLLHLAQPRPLKHRKQLMWGVVGDGLVERPWREWQKLEPERTASPA